MSLSILKKSPCTVPVLVAVPVLFAACQSREFNPAEPEALTGSKTADAERLGLSFSDLNPASAKAKMNAAIRTARHLDNPTLNTKDCVLPDGKIIPDGEADVATDNSAVYYCKDGVTKKAAENRFLKELAQEAGATDEELNNVKIYLVPLDIANAWASSPKKGRGRIVVYQGIMRFDFLSAYFPIADDGALAGVIVHELGHVKDMRKVGFTNLNDREQSLLRYCDIYINKAQTEAEVAARKDTCYLRLQAQVRAYEHSADANVPVTFQRKLPHLTLNPYKLGEWFDNLGDGKTKATSSHPDGKERNFYLTKALQEAGIPKDIPSRDSTVNATNNSLAD